MEFPQGGLLVQFRLMSSSDGLLCVSSISFEVLVNCGKSQQFKLSRGLRQRDPLCDKGGLKYLRMDRKARLEQGFERSNKWVGNNGKRRMG